VIVDESAGGFGEIVDVRVNKAGQQSLFAEPVA
jgi:hypothetical protein